MREYLSVHCCKKHGCKYGDEDCPVTAGNESGNEFCEDCRDDMLDEKIQAWADRHDIQGNISELRCMVDDAQSLF